MPDIEKLRRFSLLSSLALLVFTFSGIELDSSGKISVLGIPFIMTNPDSIMWGLVLMASYGLARYFYYAVMLGNSPYIIRKDAMHNLVSQIPGQYGKYKGSIFLSPECFSTSPMIESRDEVNRELQSIIDAFPKVNKFRVTGEVKPFHGHDDEGEPFLCFFADVKVPKICQIVAFVQDLDYTAPVWFGALSILCSVVQHWI
ncbi:hypothetical protein ACQEXU_21630 [Vibrio sp. TRT 21S02]|uniref:hypothetical protein n=1 Tax=Vibrio sp. TRT 21S02 TaxID=3418507 RepID=UPI003CEB52CA